MEISASVDNGLGKKLPPLSESAGVKFGCILKERTMPMMIMRHTCTKMQALKIFISYSRKQLAGSW